MWSSFGFGGEKILRVERHPLERSSPALQEFARSNLEHPWEPHTYYASRCIMESCELRPGWAAGQKTKWRVAYSLHSPPPSPSAADWKRLFPNISANDAISRLMLHMEYAWRFVASQKDQRTADATVAVIQIVSKSELAKESPTEVKVADNREPRALERALADVADDRWHLAFVVISKGVQLKGWRISFPFLSSLGWTQWGQPMNAASPERIKVIDMPASSIRDPFVPGLCAACKQPPAEDSELEGKLRRCARCGPLGGQYYYCSQQCCANHWPVHKVVCKEIRKAAKEAGVEVK